jgi:hypothetical protein
MYLFQIWYRGVQYPYQTLAKGNVVQHDNIGGECLVKANMLKKAKKLSILCLAIIIVFSASVYVTAAENAETLLLNGEVVEVENFSELVDAIIQANPGAERKIVLINDIEMAASIYIPANVKIVLTSCDTGGPHTLSLADSGFRHFVVKGTMILESVIVEGLSADVAYNGGIEVLREAHLILNEGGEIRNNHAFWGGGVYLDVNSTFEMTGGEISGNTAEKVGGGVLVFSNNNFLMTGGEIKGNSALAGGGVVLIFDNFFTMQDGKISGNSAVSYGGGGILVGFDNNLFIHGGTISYNRAPFGGGLYISWSEITHLNIEITPAAVFTGNYDINDF